MLCIALGAVLELCSMGCSTTSSVHGVWCTEGGALGAVHRGVLGAVREVYSTGCRTRDAVHGLRQGTTKFPSTQAVLGISKKKFWEEFIMKI